MGAPRSGPLPQILLNRRHCAEFLKVSDAIVTGIRPEVVKKHQGQVFFDVQKLVQARIEQIQKKMNSPAGSKTQEETRLIRTKADRSELELAQYRNQIHSADVVLRVWIDQIIRFRTRMLAIPVKLATRFSALDDPLKIEKILVKEVKEVLDELREYSAADFARVMDLDDFTDLPKTPRKTPAAKKKKTAPKKAAKKKAAPKKKTPARKKRAL